MFKIGQKVVCKDAKNTIGITEGNIYNIEGIIKCSKCNKELLLLNPDFHISFKLCICNEWVPDNSFYSYRFELLKYDLLDNKDIISEIIEEKADIKIPELVEN